MHWIIEALANVFLELLGDLMSWTIHLLTDLKFDMSFNIGYDEGGFTFGSVVNHLTKHSNLLEDTFIGAEQFTPYVMGAALSICFMIYITKMFIAMGGPFTKSEDPGTLTIRFIFSMVGVTASYSLFAGLEYIFNSVYQKFMEVFADITADAKKYAITIPDPGAASKVSDKTGSVAQSTPDKLSDLSANQYSVRQYNYGGNSNEDAFQMIGKDIIKSYDANQSLAIVIIEIAVFAVLLIAFIKLVLEIYERYVMLGVLYYFAPLAFATGVSKESNVLSSYLQMVICEFIVMCSNLFFTGVFIKAWTTILNTENDYLFETPGEFVTKLFLLISWLVIGQQFDQHLKGLGMSTAQTGQGLGAAMFAGGAAAVAGVAGMAKGAAGFGTKVASGQTTIQRGMNQNAGIFGVMQNKREQASPFLGMSKDKANDWLNNYTNPNSGLRRQMDGLEPRRQAQELARRVDASMGGDLGKNLAKTTNGGGINDIASASFSNGEFRGKMNDGKEFSFYNNAHGKGEVNPHQSVDIGNGWERNIDRAEGEKMISDWRKSHPEASNLDISSDGTYAARVNINGVDTLMKGQVDGLAEGKGFATENTIGFGEKIKSDYTPIQAPSSEVSRGYTPPEERSGRYRDVDFETEPNRSGRRGGRGYNNNNNDPDNF